ncbi:hypothetical protein EJ07DRAFT_158857 [Lizonia empirigonia]|nr:hypothetical protein EJ07DRAFT_158857 [Lizonia empirigonia]
MPTILQPKLIVNPVFLSLPSVTMYNKSKCRTCNELAQCLQDLATQASQDQHTYIAAQVRLVGSNIELQLRRTEESRELKKASSRLERYRRENARMKDILAHMQQKLSETEQSQKQRVECAEDLACASALLRLRHTSQPIR